jgi:hypothetical protein
MWLVRGSRGGHGGGGGDDDDDEDAVDGNLEEHQPPSVSEEVGGEVPANPVSDFEQLEVPKYLFLTDYAQPTPPRSPRTSWTLWLVISARRISTARFVAAGLTQRRICAAFARVPQSKTTTSK